MTVQVRTSTPLRGAPEYDPRAPLLPMANHHVELICCTPPRKVTTLRTQAYSGWYVLSLFGQRVCGVHIAPVLLAGRDRLPIRYTGLTLAEREGLGLREGYQSAAAFEAAMRQQARRWPHLLDFIEGRRALILHRIKQVIQF